MCKEKMKVQDMETHLRTNKETIFLIAKGIVTVQHQKFSSPQLQQCEALRDKLKTFLTVPGPKCNKENWENKSFTSHIMYNKINNQIGLHD